MNAPPNIDELGNLVLLRQALDILEAPGDIQRGLYPIDRDPAEEMRLLFRDAWRRVRPVFGAALPGNAQVFLDEIDRALDQDLPDWEGIRHRAATVSAVLPRAGGRHGPHPWLDQIVRGHGRLLLRRQL
jgi:hypothetical protein